jgi:sulfate transport system substrate-binding protein
VKRLIGLIAVLALAGVSGCGGASDETGGSSTGSAGAGGGATTTLNLVAYSTPQVVYDEIVPDFQKTADGKGVDIKGSYGASGDQSRAVEAGQKADVVTFSTEPDMTRLVKAGLVADDWNAGPNKGLVTTSVVTFVVRKGNPKHIRTWDDLLKPGVKVLTPNPFTSGAAKWNLLAAYGQAADRGKDPKAGLAYVRKLLTEHVKVQDKSGREALQNFTSGDADVLLSYEYEATTANKKGEDLDYVIPDDTIKINIDIATTKDAPEQAKKFVDYVLSDPAQERFASWGYRPVNESVLAAHKSEFPDPPGLFTIEDLGGWPKVNDEMFDPEKGSIAKIEEEAGVSTAK